MGEFSKVHMKVTYASSKHLYKALILNTYLGFALVAGIRFLQEFSHSSRKCVNSCRNWIIYTQTNKLSMAPVRDTQLKDTTNNANTSKLCSMTKKPVLCRPPCERYGLAPQLLKEPAMINYSVKLQQTLISFGVVGNFLFLKKYANSSGGQRSIAIKI